MHVHAGSNVGCEQPCVLLGPSTPVTSMTLLADMTNICKSIPERSHVHEPTISAAPLILKIVI